MDTITIGSNVRYIDSYMFAHLPAHTVVRVLATVPPAITATTFAACSDSTVFIVPCGSLADYRSALYWGDIVGLQEECSGQELCMVSVQGGRNRLVWNPMVENISGYNLYRESVVAGEYELVGSVPVSEATAWTDSTSRPTSRSYRYRMSVMDMDGNESALSAVHKTMHLSINQGLGGRWNLQWTPYEGADYTTYVIYRGTSASDLEQIDIMPADGNTSYTDEDPIEGDVYYQVGIVMSNGCSDPEAVALATKSASISRSNIATNSSTMDISPAETGSHNVRVRDGRVLVEGCDGCAVRVYDQLGRGVENRNLPAGVYLVRVDGHAARKVVVVR